MVCFKRNVPILRAGNCLFQEYSPDWLADLLDRSAESAGIELPFRNDLVAAVFFYLEDDCSWQIMPLDVLFRRIRRMLCDVGLGQLAEHFSELPPPVDVPVDEIAQRNPLFLFFVTGLEAEVNHLESQGLTNLHFSGKKDCVRVLQGYRKWTRNSDTVLDDLNFILSKYSPDSQQATEGKDLFHSNN
jgi:hypothetical protein